MASIENRFITVVSGLPRSGTSMMMRMLEAGGVPIVTDGLREPDEDNPQGYYEFEPVKQLNKNTSWLADAHDKAVKIIHLLLYSLPQDHQYKVIFMRRKLDEVIASQTTMVRRRREVGSTLNGAQLAEAFGYQIQKLDQWINGQDNFSMLYINYKEVLENPEKTVLEIDRFLGLELDTQAMIKVVDPSLYRQRF